MFLLVIVLLFALIAIVLYNGLIRKKNEVDNAFGGIDVQLKKRYDLIPNLVATVQQYATHEKDLLQRVTELRAQTLSNQLSTNEKVALDNQMSGALRNLMVSVENYPDLKSDGLFRDLNVQLEGTENRIATARGRYIREVQGYNTFIRQFPTLITAKIFGYKVLPNFGVENQDTIMQRPTIQFDNPRSAPAQ